MPYEFGTRDVFEQVDARLGNVEQDIRGVRSEISGLRRDFENRFDRVHQEIGGLRPETNARFDRVHQDIASQGRWLVGILLASWMSQMASFWLKP